MISGHLDITVLAATAVCEFRFNKSLLWSARGSCEEVLCKKGVLEISQNSQENACARVFFK